ncbi:hypothetical protein N7G274_003438 [Stereocaulon virgatum]|uniref:PARP-type domain-containing protein n=1 Tax=Stereocaulon virgatum TaxID=373712 RepID=A0ABR4ADR8_9LECA
MSYRVEIAPSKRAGCQNTACKKEGIKIPKGALRCGVFVTIMDNQTWKWKHWGCVTPKQIATINEDIENDVNLLDGLEELPEDLQEKVKTALAAGHVADDDWSGDVEMNRPGMKGYRTPASKKAKREEAKAQKEFQADGEGESASPSKPSSRKDSQANPEAGDGDDYDQQPASKKRKAAPKKPKKTAGDNEHDASKDEHKPAKRSKKNKPKAEAEATVGIKDEKSDRDALPDAPAKKMRAPRKSAEKVKDEGNENFFSNDTPKQVKKAPTKRTRAPRQASATKKVKREESETKESSDGAAGGSGLAKSDQDDEFDSTGEEDAAEAAPMPKKGGKKATNGKAAVAASQAKARPKAKRPSNEAGKPKQTNGRPIRGKTS